MAKTELPPRFAQLYAALTLLSLLGAMDTSIVATALPTIVGEFNQTENISWVIAGYTLAVAVMVPVYGKLADKYGSNRLIVGILVLFLGASVLCGLAPNLGTLTVGRVLQGFGGGGLGVLPFTVLSTILPERSRPKYMAPMSAVWAVAAIGGPVLGGVLTDTVGWRWIFFINLPLGALAWLLASRALPHQQQLHHNKLFNWHTWILFAVASTLTVFSTHGIIATAGREITPETVFMGSLAVLAIGLFIWRSIVSSDPVIPVRILSNRGALTVLVIGTLSATNLFAITNYVPTLLQMGFDVPATLAGLGLLPMVLGMVVTSIIMSRWVSKTGRWHHLPPIGTAIAALSMFSNFLFAPMLGPWFIVLTMGVSAIGVGLYGMLNLTLVQAFSKAKVYGAVTATVNVSRDLTGTIVATIAGGVFGFGVVNALTKVQLPQPLAAASISPADLALLDAATKSQVQQAYIGAFQPVFLNSTIAFVVVFVLAWTLPKLDLKSSH